MIQNKDPLHFQSLKTKQADLSSKLGNLAKSIPEVNSDSEPETQVERG